MRESIVEQIDCISEGDGRLRGHRNLWITLFMDREFVCYRCSDTELLKCMFVLSRFVLKYLLVPLVDMSVDAQLEVIRTDCPYDPARSPCSNLIELEGRYFGSGVRRYRKMLFCITEDIFFHYERDVIALFVNMDCDVNDIHFYAA